MRIGSYLVTTRTLIRHYMFIRHTRVLWSSVTGYLLPTFLLKAVTQVLFFSGVTTFSSLSADLESKLKPRSVYRELNTFVYETEEQANLLAIAI